jgi:hypothetical protein
VHPTSSGTTSKQRRRAAGQGFKHWRKPGDRAQRAVGERRALGEHTQSAATEAADTGRRGGRAPVAHVGTIARHCRAANTGQNGKGEARAPKPGGSRHLTAM